MLLWAYIGFYLALSWMGIREDLRRRMPLWYLILVVAGGIATAAGMVLLAGWPDSMILRNMWRIPSILVALVFVFEVGHSVMTYSPKDSDGVPEEQAKSLEGCSIITGTIVGVALFLPAIWLNLAYAFNRI